MPLKLACWSLAHRGLPCPQLGDGLELLDRGDRLFEELDVRVAVRCLIADGFKQDRVFLQMLRWSGEEVLEIEPMGVGVAGALLRDVIQERRSRLKCKSRRNNKPPQSA